MQINRKKEKKEKLFLKNKTDNHHHVPKQS